jgi:hypothetical protein
MLAKGFCRRLRDDPPHIVHQAGDAGDDTRSSDTKSGCIMGICRNDFRYSPTLLLRNWNNGIVPRKTLSRAATGRWSGCSPKGCPPHEWQPSPAIRPTGYAPSLNAITSTAPRGWVTGATVTREARGCSRPCSVPPWPAHSTGPHPMAGCGPGRRSPHGWPPRSGARCTPTGLGDAPAPQLAPQSAAITACQGRARHPGGL